MNRAIYDIRWTIDNDDPDSGDGVLADIDDTLLSLQAAGVPPNRIRRFAAEDPVCPWLTRYFITYNAEPIVMGDTRYSL